MNDQFKVQSETANVSEVQDEFFSSPEQSPLKKLSSPVENRSPVDEILPGNEITGTEERLSSGEASILVSVPADSIVDMKAENSNTQDEQTRANKIQHSEIESPFQRIIFTPKTTQLSSSPKKQALKNNSHEEIVRPRIGLHRKVKDTSDSKKIENEKAKLEKDVKKIPKLERIREAPLRNNLAREAKLNLESVRPKRKLSGGSNQNSKTSGIEVERAKKKTKRLQIVTQKNIEKKKEEKKTLLKRVKADPEEIVDIRPSPAKTPVRSPAKTPVGSSAKTPTKSAHSASPARLSPNKLPTYTTMIRSALEDMNCVGGEGCTKLEILLHILRKFQPKGNVSSITSKLVQVLDRGIKQGHFLSSVSLPRVVRKPMPGLKPIKQIDNIKSKDKKVGKKKVLSSKVVRTKENKKDKATKTKSKQTENSTDKKVKKNSLQTPRRLKEPLATICKAKKLTRKEVLQKVWVYIKLKKLQDSNEKTKINCDANLRKLTKCKQIKTSAVLGYLKPFME